jgi:hypothetical protein
MRAKVGFLVLALWGCSSEKSSSKKIAAYEATDPCSQHMLETDCTADTSNACQWIGLGIPCADNTECPSGICQAADPCRAHTDDASCLADPACDWAAAELCTPDDCNGGFCYTKTDGCECVCPAYCPAGADCPPCTCDCPPPDPGGGGDDCTCVCPSCEPGQICPPCDCNCDGGGTGCGDSTCTCVCPACEPGQPCPPCDCNCGTTEPPTTCACEPCVAGETCPPCECPDMSDPCLDHTDEASCLADGANACQWLQLGIPCFEGEPCVSGVCQHLDDGGTGDDCTCVCPDCPPGEECLPCACAASGSTGGGTGTNTGG